MKVTYELTVYKDAEQQFDQYIASSYNTQNFDMTKSLYISGLQLLTNFMKEEGGIEPEIKKLDGKPEDAAATYEITVNDIYGKYKNNLNNFGNQFTGDKASGKPYQSLLLKQLGEVKTDMGFVKGQAYQNGQIIDILQFTD